MPINANTAQQPAAQPKPIANPGSNGAVDPATQPASSPGGKSSNTTATEALQQQINNQTNAVKQTNNKDVANNNYIQSSVDYLDRKNALSANNNIQKVALVGRTGAGARALTAGVGKASTVGDSMTVVVFEATPEMSESGSTNLVNIGDIRAAASVVIYMGSPSRTFGLQATFVSRTADEATQNFKYISALKAWRTPTLKQGESYGAEPETLRLYAYGQVLKGIPVMISSINVTYPNEVDYIQTTGKENDQNAPSWVPIIQQVSIGLLEVRSIDDLASFDYETFKKGTLDQW